ncbi:MAG TPA: hypothetical protein VLF66_03440 [Thermoanaerobaculia bacterium]|nr:hypothetical protein [Thermoanaerobaculia bacterium]
MDHPAPETLREFVLTRLSESDDGRVEEHLRRGCEACLFKAREFFPLADFSSQESIQAFVRAMHLKGDPVAADQAEGRLDEALRQAVRRRFLFDCEAALTPELLRELEHRPPAKKRDVVRTAERYQLFGFVEGLCEASRAAGFSDVARALELAELAVAVADCLDPRIYLPVLTADQQALARAFLGNARRVASDLFGADQAFHEGRPFLREGTKSPIVRAEFSSLHGSLLIYQARYREARRVLEGARKEFERWGEPRDVGRVLLQLGSCAGYAGEVERAVEVCSEAARVLESVQDERLRLSAHHNLTDWMVETGEALEALARFQKAQPLYDRCLDDLGIQLRRRWVEGRIHAALGDFEIARRAFEEVRALAARRGLAYELAMVSLEEAILDLNRSDLARVQDLAEELFPIFRSQDLHAHALASLYLFRDRARAEKATVGFLQEIVRYLRRAQHNPFLIFNPSARWG